MKGIIILAHGSKRKETEDTLNSLVEKVKVKTGEKLVYPAYLQFSKISLEVVIDRLVYNGANEIKIIPLFLFDGVHITQDIPKEIDEIKSKYPNIKIEMSSHIGDDDRVADIIADRISSLK